jgi:hypothetical protein
MKLFNREFNHLDASFLQDLQTLEDEGALYFQFWLEELNDSRFCRIRLTPSEIVEYVDAITAFNEFQGYYQKFHDPDLALSLISNVEVRKRVEEYNEWTISIGQDDTAFCFAAFAGDDLEGLLCGGATDRYEYLSGAYSGDRRFILTEILEMFPTAAGHLLNRNGSRPSYRLEEEQDVRDLLYSMIKSVFPDTRIEEHTRIHAGSAKRIDIVIPRISTMIEIKYVRNSRHAKKVADELRIDFESYHAHPDCKKLIAYVWDTGGNLIDRSNFIKDLRGLRIKGNSRFSVDIMIKP